MEALDAGADDYVTKPFSIQELLARVRAHLRRAPERTVDAPIEIGDFTVDASRAHRGMYSRQSPAPHSDRVRPTASTWPAMPARLLTHQRPADGRLGRAKSAHQPEYLRVFIGQLRRKLEAEGPRQYIQTEPWVGYRFLPEGVPE